LEKLKMQTKFLFGKPGGKRPPKRPRHRWEYNIRTDLEIRREDADWMHRAGNRDKWRTEASGSIKGEEFPD
jgi:hypothetical protein